MVSDLLISEQSEQTHCQQRCNPTVGGPKTILHHGCAEQKLANYSQRPRLVQSTQYIVQIKL